MPDRLNNITDTVPLVSGFMVLILPGPAVEAWAAGATHRAVIAIASKADHCLIDLFIVLPKSPMFVYGMTFNKDVIW